MNRQIIEARNLVNWLKKHPALSNEDRQLVESIEEKNSWTIRNEVSQLIALRCKYDVDYHIDLLSKAITSVEEDTIQKLTLKASYLEAIVDLMS